MVVAFLSSCILKTNVCVKKKTPKNSILPSITITQMTKNQKEKDASYVDV